MKFNRQPRQDQGKVTWYSSNCDEIVSLTDIRMLHPSKVGVVQ